MSFVLACSLTVLSAGQLECSQHCAVLSLVLEILLVPVSPLTHLCWTSLIHLLLVSVHSLLSVAVRATFDQRTDHR